MAEERKKIVSLDILEYYDSRVKNWVMNRISQIEKGEVTEQEVKDMIAAAFVEEKIPNEQTVQDMIDASGELIIM